MSRGRLGAFLGLLLLFAVLGPLLAGAQAPQTPKVYQVKLTVQPVSDKITVSHGTADFSYAVTFDCLQSSGRYEPCTGTAGDQDIAITLTFPSAASIPAGWAVTFTPGTTSKALKAKESYAFDATVKLVSDNPKKDELGFTVNVNARPVAPGGGLLDPVVGQAAQPSDAGATASVRKEITAAEKITGVLRTYMWPLLGGAMIVILAAIVLRRRNHPEASAAFEPRLRVESDARLQPASPGRGASFPIRIQNEAREPDKVDLSIVNLPSGWTAILPLNELELEPNERTELWVTVRAPAEAKAARVPFEFRARSKSGHGEARLPLEVEVTPAPPSRGDWKDVPPPPPVDAADEPTKPKSKSKRKGT